MNTTQKNFLIACVVVLILIIVYYVMVPSPGATTVVNTSASGTMSTVTLDNGSVIVIDHTAKTAVVTTTGGATTTVDISSLSSAYTPEQIAAVINITTASGGTIPSNNIRMFNQTAFQGASFDMVLDGTELVYTAQGGWDYSSFKMGAFDSSVGGVALRFSNNKADSKIVLFFNLTGDVDDLPTTIGALPASANYASLFDGTQDIYVDLVRYADAVVEAEQLQQDCIANVPSAGYNCMIEFDP